MRDSYQEIFNTRGQRYHRAMQRYPHARDAEFNTLLTLSKIPEHAILADIPAGGCYLNGYLSETVTVYSVETSRAFLSSCPKQRRNQPILTDSLFNIPIRNGSIDRIFSLAGLHHITDREPVYKEMAQLLKPNGLLAIADVERGSGVARFLNGFVNQHNPMGHRGHFLDHTDTAQLNALGFIRQQNETKPCPWYFDNRAAMVNFCSDLFGLDTSLPMDSVLDALYETVGFDENHQGITLNWALWHMVALTPDTHNSE
ncbi:MAG: class I SAM-dependent methyltransferase [Magnetococcales bacterium]|nr:class I SAM-dependent methyltransferase [Magnetococcales bacterium]